MKTLDINSTYVQKCFDFDLVGRAIKSVYDGIDFVGHVCSVNGEVVLIKY